MFGDIMKMNVLFSLFVCFLLAGFVVAQGANETLNVSENGNGDANNSKALNSAVIEARYENVEYGYEKTLTAMDAVINYFSNSNKTNISTSLLVELRETFSSLFVGLQQYVNASDPSGFGKQVAEMHKTAAQFKSESAKIAAPGEMGDLRKLIQNRTDEKENETEMQEIKERIKEFKAKTYKIACELNLARIKKFNEKIEAQNISSEELKNVSARIQEKCANITQIKNESQLNMKIQSIKELFTMGKLKVIAHAKIANEKAMEKANDIVNALENKGYNVSAVRESLDEMQTIRNEVGQACINATNEECVSKINELRNRTNDLSSDIKVIVRENIKNIKGNVSGR